MKQRTKATILLTVIYLLGGVGIAAMNLNITEMLIASISFFVCVTCLILALLMPTPIVR